MVQAFGIFALIAFFLFMVASALLMGLGLGLGMPSRY
jgi:hypothetical protein